MHPSDWRLYLGYVEQALAGGSDPLLPAISISRNGTLAKWRGKLHFIDVRVNDPGLANHRQVFEETLTKAGGLGIECVLTLPEFKPIYHEPPPPPPPRDTGGKPKKPFVSIPVAEFRPCFLALPRLIAKPESCHVLTAEECLPVIALGKAHGVRHLIVPVSEPGLFLDPAAAREFLAKLKVIGAAAKEAGITLHLRNGGLTPEEFKRFKKETGCRFAMNVGIAHLERNELVDYFERFRAEMDFLMLQQVLPGVDKWRARQGAMALAIISYRQRLEEFRAATPAEMERDRDYIVGRLIGAWRDYQETCRNQFMNLGLFQNGDLNLVPLLKLLRAGLEEGCEWHLLFETVPNIKNAEFVSRYLLPEGLSGLM